jgi:hypothetical protein
MHFLYENLFSYSFSYLIHSCSFFGALYVLFYFLFSHLLLCLRCCGSFDIMLSCLALPCLALPCLALSCLALPCLALPCLALPCLALSCPVLSCPVLSFHSFCLSFSLHLSHPPKTDFFHLVFSRPVSSYLNYNIQSFFMYRY